MSDKKTAGTKATSETNDKLDASKPPRASTVPAMDLSLEAITVPPPPVSGASSGGALSIPRAPRVPTDNKPAAAPAKRKRSEDDLFSVFDVESSTAAEDIPITVQPEPVPEKPKSRLGTRSPQEREVTRSRQIPIDQDLFNLSVGLFSTPQQTTLGAPDMSAPAAPGLSDNAAPKTSSLFDDLVLPTASTPPIAPPDSIDLLAPKPVAPKPAKYSSPTSHRTVLFVGIAAALVAIGGVFFFVQQSSTSTEATAALQPLTTSTESALDTRPGQTNPADEPQVRTAKTDKQDEAASPTKPASTLGSGAAPKDASDKPAQTGSSDKQVGQGKPTEAEAAAKPPEPAAPTGPSKSQSLAEAMAAAAPGGGAPPPPPPSSGPEFNKAAASAALNGAAGSAAGCKAAGDPSGVARVSVTFAASGRATRAIVNGPPFAGTATGSCVAGAFRSLSVPPFTGDAVTVSKSVTIR